MWAAKFVINQSVGYATKGNLTSCDGRQGGQNCCWSAKEASSKNMPKCNK
jgi:hypothetical protein